MSANQNSGSASGSASAESRGRARFRAVPTRTVMVFPTRDGDHITVTISIGKLGLCLGCDIIYEHRRF